MDQQTKLIILSVVGGMVVMGVIVFIWSTLRAIKSAGKRKFGGRRDQDNPLAMNCPPTMTGYCVPARVSIPDQTPVAIYGVRNGDCGCDGDQRLSQAQVQQIVDRANKLRQLKQDTELDELLGQLRVTPKPFPRSDAS
jgi:hypothetical protein